MTEPISSNPTPSRSPNLDPMPQMAQDVFHFGSFNHKIILGIEDPETAALAIAQTTKLKREELSAS